MINIILTTIYILGIFVTFANVVEDVDFKSIILSLIFSFLWPLWLFVILMIGLYNLIRNVVIKIKKYAK